MSDAFQVVLGPHVGEALLALFLWINLAAAAAIVAVAAVRLPVRRVFGPATAYQLWGAPPLAALLATAAFFMSPKPDPLAAVLHAQAPALTAMLAAWAVGAALVAAVFALAQGRFQAELKAGRGGPAVVGVIAPRIVMPADDGRYSPEERELIRAHEREHVARKDPRTVALAALAQCVCWFNPFVHLAARLLRLDQELACDAAVMLTRPKARSLYAKTLLKTQLAATPLPLGCYWPARGQHPLEVRVALLKRRSDATSPSAPGSAVVMAGPGAIRP